MVLVVYSISLIVFGVGVFRIKKSASQMKVVSMLYLFFMMIMAQQAFFAGIMDKLQIPITLGTMSFINIVAGVVLYLISTQKGVQDYEPLQWTDGLVLILGLLLTAVMGIQYFGTDLEARFVSVDASAHFHLAKDILSSHSLGNIMYFEALNDSVFMNFGAAFSDSASAPVQAFVFSQLVSLFLGFMGLYAFLREGAQEKKEPLLAGVVSVFYTVGFPLYAIIYGFAYFGQVINVIVAIMIFTKVCQEKKIKPFFSCYVYWMLLFAVFVCYSYFVPPVFVAVFLCIWLGDKDDLSFGITLEKVKKEFAVFLLPTCYGLFMSFGNVKELGNGGGITNDGGCYFDLYSNFLKLLPFVLVGIVFLWKKKKNTIQLHMLIVTVVYILFLLTLNYYRKASLYYVSKAYSLLWVCTFIYLFICLADMMRNHRVLFGALGLTVVVAFGLMTSHIGERVRTKNNDAYITVYEDAKVLFPQIYWFNRQYLQLPHYLPSEKIEFFSDVAQTYCADTKHEIVVVGNDYSLVWFQAITDMDIVSVLSGSEMKEKDGETTDYIVILDGTEESYITYGEVVCSNEYGTVIKTKNE